MPLLFSTLPDQAPPREATSDRAKYWRILSALGELCLQPELFEILVIRLTTKLDLICIPAMKSPSAQTDAEPTAAYAHAILTVISTTLTKKAQKGDADLPKYRTRLTPRIYNLFIHSALLSETNYMVAAHPRLIAVAAQIITAVTQTIPAE